MRAIFDSSFNSEEPVISESVKLHHLSKVLRIKEGEEILILKGNGEKYLCQIEKISKKQVGLKILDFELVKREVNLTVSLGITKRDALDYNIKQAVELGVKKIIFTQTDFSQKYDFNSDRIKRLIESAIEQSNSAFYPQLETKQSLEDIDDNFDYKIAFVSEIKQSDNIEIKMSGEVLVYIGPEGGFSPAEVKLLKEKASCIKLNTNILRATTALPVAIGFLHGKCV